MNYILLMILYMDKNEGLDIMILLIMLRIR